MQGSFEHQVVAVNGTQQGRIGGGVERHKDVGHDAAATVDGAMLFERVVHLGRVEADAVDRGEFAVRVAVVEVAVVGLFLPLGVGLLDAAAGRRVVMRHGEANHGAVGEVDGALHQTLAEGAAANDGAAVVVLNGTAHNFGS